MRSIPNNTNWLYSANPAMMVADYMSPRVCRAPESELGAVQTLATGQAVTDAIRTESWNGREYTVVPVVAIVEGVLQGANAKTPELATAKEFGKFPKTWDGRPVVMNHPQLKGVFVSAAIPEVLEDFGLGMIFNSKIEDKKLKCEAWLDHARIEELGGESLSTLERIRNGEVVDVSVGAFLDVISRPGTFEGKAYGGVWQNVVPDHLAFLSAGVPGACSVSDGCGVPRLFHSSAAVIGTASACCESCAEGGECGEHNPSVNAGAEALLASERSASFHALLAEQTIVVEDLAVRSHYHFTGCLPTVGCYRSSFPYLHRPGRWRYQILGGRCSRESSDADCSTTDDATQCQSDRGE
jgi:hypothetical protein